MKRLKKASIDLSKFLISLLLDNYYTQEKIQQVIDENQDCLYSGEAYRVLLFYKEDIENALSEFLNEIGQDQINENDNIHYYINNVIDKLININGKYQSFSKTMRGVNSAASHLFSDKLPNEFNIIICMEVSNALDIKLLVEKYKKELDAEASEAFNIFKDQEEILAKLTNNDFWIINPEQFIRIFKRYKRS